MPIQNLSSVDSIGALIHDYGKSMGVEPSEALNLTFSTPNYFCSVIHQSIPPERMMHLGANVMYSVLFSALNRPYPPMMGRTIQDLEGRIRDYFESVGPKGKYEEILEDYGLSVSIGNAFIVAGARREDILRLGESYKKDHDVMEGNEISAVASTYNTLIGNAIVTARDRVPYGVV
jgi:hypothetical protein